MQKVLIFFKAIQIKQNAFLIKSNSIFNSRLNIPSKTTHIRHFSAKASKVSVLSIRETINDSICIQRNQISHYFNIPIISYSLTESFYFSFVILITNNQSPHRNCYDEYGRTSNYTWSWVSSIAYSMYVQHWRWPLKYVNSDLIQRSSRFFQRVSYSHFIALFYNVYLVTVKLFNWVHCNLG